MGNLWQDLNFERTVQNTVRDFEFTKRAYKDFYHVVNLDEFEDQDAQVIFQYLYKKMGMVSFGDYLKRYLYERSMLAQPFSLVPLEDYKNIIIQSFERTGTPKSMKPTSTKLRTLATNWLTQASVKRETIFLLGFGLDMEVSEVKEFLLKAQRERDFDFTDPCEVIYWYCYQNHHGYEVAQRMRQRYEELPVAGQKRDLKDCLDMLKSGQIRLNTHEGVWKYLSLLREGSLKSDQEAYRWFVRLMEHSRRIIARMYQKDVEEVRGSKRWKAQDISPGDVEKVIFNGVPVDNMGNLKKMSASILSKHFAQKRLSRQRINQILNRKQQVERFDLITLEFFIISQEMEDADAKERYRFFRREIQQILKECSMGELYIVNPYECFILMCLLTDCPLAVFSEIWEMSYEAEEL